MCAPVGWVISEVNHFKSRGVQNSDMSGFLRFVFKLVFFSPSVYTDAFKKISKNSKTHTQKIKADN